LNIADDFLLAARTFKISTNSLMTLKAAREFKRPLN